MLLNRMRSFHSATSQLFEESVIEFKSTICSKFYQQSSENQFQTNWYQLFMNINMFNSIVVVSSIRIFVNDDSI